VDAITPQAAIYLTVKFDLKGKKADGKVLESQEDVTQYLLNEAQLAGRFHSTRLARAINLRGTG
jgi:aspartate aminotransferase